MIVMGDQTETAGGHATEVRTETGHPTAMGTGAETAETTVAGGTIPATDGAAATIPATAGVTVTARRIPPRGAATPTAHAPVLIKRQMGWQAKMARCVFPCLAISLIPQLTRLRPRSQLSLHQPKRRQRQRKRLSDCANSKP
jgi:hypothetical protein